MKNKNNMLMYGALILLGGVVIYSLTQQKKKRNKLEVDVKQQIADLQGQLQKTKNNVTSMQIQSSPELQKTLSTLTRFGKNL